MIYHSKKILKKIVLCVFKWYWLWKCEMKFKKNLNFIQIINNYHVKKNDDLIEYIYYMFNCLNHNIINEGIWVTPIYLFVKC